MHEKTLKLAAAISQASAGEMPLLEALCTAAEADLSGRLREGWTPERCGDAFSCAAAMVTAAGMLTCRANGGVEQLTAGEVSLRLSGNGTCETAAMLRRHAAALMAPYCRDDSFAFAGVRG